MYHPKDIDIDIGTVELIIAHQLKSKPRDDAQIYEHLRSVAQSRRHSSRNFSKRNKNRAVDLTDIISPLVKRNQIKYPHSLLDVGCAEGK